MTSEEFSDLVTEQVESLRSRIMGVGDSQYSNGDKQKIEAYSDTHLLDEAIAELDDFVVYAVYMRSRMAVLRNTILEP
jgi:hypothetical protein